MESLPGCCKAVEIAYKQVLSASCFPRLKPNCVTNVTGKLVTPAAKWEPLSAAQNVEYASATTAT